MYDASDIELNKAVSHPIFLPCLKSDYYFLTKPEYGKLEMYKLGSE